jgi:hypothetical protein
MHFNCNHLLKICLLSDESADIFEDGEHGADASTPLHGLSAAIKEKAKPLIEGIIIFVIIMIHYYMTQQRYVIY